MVRLTKTAKAVVDQLAKYGAVAVEGPNAGYMRDRAGGEWRWEVFLNEVTFTRPGWRTRTVTADNVSENMFKWLFNLEETRTSLEFPITLEEAVAEFGIEAVYRAYLRFRKIDELADEE